MVSVNGQRASLALTCVDWLFVAGAAEAGCTGGLLIPLKALSKHFLHSSYLFDSVSMAVAVSSSLSGSISAMDVNPSMIASIL